MKQYKYQRLPTEEYNKALFQARGQVNGIMEGFKVYGMNRDAEEAVEEIMKVIEQFGMRVRGKDIPILVRTQARRKPTE